DMGPPQSHAEQLSDAGGKMLAANIPAMGAVSKLANAGRYTVTETPTLLNAAKTTYNRVMDSAARRPLATVGGEALASEEAGAGGEVARQSAENNGHGETWQRNAETIGQAVSPFAVQVLPSALVAKGVSVAAR